MNLMPFDELNTFKAMVTEYKTEPLTLSEKEKLHDDIEDYIEFLLIEAYEYGNVQAMSDLGILDKDPASIVNPNEMFAVINEPIAGKTYMERTREYLDAEDSTVEDFMRVAETDTARVYNAGVEAGGRNSGVPGIMKRWITMDDERVRSTHQYLEMRDVPITEDFWTWDGDHAKAPGLFTLPENNVNCRCYLELFTQTSE